MLKGSVGGDGVLFTAPSNASRGEKPALRRSARQMSKCFPGCGKNGPLARHGVPSALAALRALRRKCRYNGAFSCDGSDCASNSSRSRMARAQATEYAAPSTKGKKSRSFAALVGLRERANR